MKKIILTVAAVFAFGFANAQDKKESSEGFSKGDVFVTGAIGIDSEKTGDNKSNGFALMPQVGFFVSENIAVGAKVGFGSMKEEDKVGTTVVTTSDLSYTTFGAFGRYYFTPASKFSLFANLGVDFTGAKNNLNDAKSKQLDVTLGAGLNYFVSSNFSIEAGVGALSYSSNDNGGNGAEKTNTFGLGGNWTAVSFGVNYKF